MRSKISLFVALCLLSCTSFAAYYPWGWNGWLTSVPTITAAPTSGVQLGSVVSARDNETLYIWTGSAWDAVSGGGSSYTFADSVLDSSGTVTLLNDSATPGNSKYYGTDGSGTKGFFDVPAIPTAFTFSDSVVNTAGDVTLVNDSSTPGNSKYYGTDSGGTKGFFDVPNGTPGGSDTQVQFNSSGAFAGDSGFTYDGSGSATLSSKISASTANLSSLTASLPIVSDGSKNVVSGSVTAPITFSAGAFGCDVASGSQAGCLSSSDWTLFDSKQSALTFTDSTVNSSGTVSLVNDNATPGNSKYYGTDGTGSKGFFDVPVIPTALTFSDSVVNTSGDVTLVNDSATPGNSKYYGTDSGGSKGFFDVTPTTTLQGQSDGSAVTTYNFQVPAHQATQISGTTSLIETGNQNQLANPGFEGGSTGWTAVGGTITGYTGANVITGKTSGEFASTTIGDTLTSTAIPVTAGLAGQNGALSARFLATATGVFSGSLQAYDGTNILASVNFTPNVTTATTATVNFIFPTSGSVYLRVISTATGGTEVDDGYAGLAAGFNLSQVSQAQLVGQIKVTGCAGAWSTASTSFAAFSAQSGCTYTVLSGSASAPSTNIPAIKFSSLGPGAYILKYEGTIGAVYSSAGQTALFQFTDGTNTAQETSGFGNPSSAVPILASGIQQTINYTSAQSNVTLQIYGKIAGSGVTAQVNGTNGNPAVISVYYFPSQGQVALTPNIGPSMTDWVAYTPTLSSGFGTVTNVNFRYRRSGDSLFVQGSFNAGTVTAALGSVGLPGGLNIDGSKVSIATTTSNSSPAVGSFTAAATTPFRANALVCSSTSTSSIYMAGSDTNTNSVPAAINTVVNNGNFVQVEFSVPISGWTSPSVVMPIIVGGVSTSSAGMSGIYWAIVSSVCSSSPCAIASTSGTWLTNITRSATGTYAANIAPGYFSGPPACFIDSLNGGAGVPICTGSSAATSSTFNFLCRNGVTGDDDNFSLMCVGPH